MIDMKILKKYKPKNYEGRMRFIGENNILPENIVDVHSFIKHQETGKLRMYIKICDLTLADNLKYLGESFLIITLAIKLFAMELDVESVNLKDSEIIKILKRFSKQIKYEYAFRSNLINKKPTRYTLLKDIKKEDVEDN